MARILVIDDDVLVLDMLYESLTREGYDVLRAFQRRGRAETLSKRAC